MKYVSRVIISCIVFVTYSFAQEWEVQSGHTIQNLNDVVFLDNQNGIIIGDSAIILRTTNAGLNWSNSTSPVTNISFYKIYNIDKTNIIISGSNGTLLKSTDAGITWAVKFQEPAVIIQNVFFKDNSIGWLCGTVANSETGGVIYKTTDGGSTWIKQLETLDNSILPNYKISDIYFFNAYTGIALGYLSFDNFGPTYILKTGDSGKNWYLLSHTNSYLVTQISKTFKDTIWASGIGFEISTDSGKTWQKSSLNYVIPDFTVMYNISISDIVQLTGKRGYLIIYDIINRKRRLYYTDDIFNGIYSIKTPDYTKPLALANVENKFLCIVGLNGLILKSKWLYTGISSSPVNNSISEPGFLDIYPNPFNNSALIKYSVSKEERVQIKIFDILGRLITTLVNEVKAEGNYNVTWNGANFTSGIYICSLKLNKQVISKKMILIK